MADGQLISNESFPRIAVVPAAGLGTRFLPATKQIPKELIPVVNIPGIQLVAEEAAQAGAEKLAVIISKDKQAVVDYFHNNELLDETLAARGKTDLAQQLKKIADLIDVEAIYQDKPLGLGHAVGQAESLLTEADKAISVLLPDDLILPIGFFAEMFSVWKQYRGTVLCAFPVTEKQVSSYGIFKIKDTANSKVKQVTGMVEKPAPSEAPSNLAAAGRYILDRKIFTALKEVKPGVGGEIQLTDAIEKLIEQGEPVHLVIHEGVRHDIGNPLGFIKASVDYALNNQKYASDLTIWLQERLKEK